MTSAPGSRSSRSGRRTTRDPEVSAETRLRSNESEPADAPIDSGHYIKILRRNRTLIAFIAGGFALAACGLALLLPDSYRSTARILMDSSVDPSGPSDADSVARRLATAERLVLTPLILSRAAINVPGESARSLEEKVQATADPDANIIDVTAADDDQDRVARIANAVAIAFIESQRRLTRENVDETKAILRSRITRLGTSDETAAQREALAAQLGELELRAATAGFVFGLVEPAEPPEGKASPGPLGVALLGLIAGLVIAVLVVLGRDHLKPLVTDAQELGRLTGAPVLARVPAPSDWRFPHRSSVSVEGDAFQKLRGRAGRLLDPGRQHVILVTSPVLTPGKDAVSAALARALADTGNPTLFVSTPTYTWPPGTASDVLPSQDLARLADRAVNTPVAEQLSILTDGPALWDHERGLGYETVRTISKGLRAGRYRYVVIDGPPLLDSNDSLILAEAADEIVVVTELESVTRTDAVDMRNVLREMNTRILGSIVIEPQRGRLGRHVLAGRVGAEPTTPVWPWWTTTSGAPESRETFGSLADEHAVHAQTVPRPSS